MTTYEQQLLSSMHQNNGLFSDYYLNEIVPTLPEWDEALFAEARGVLGQLNDLRASIRFPSFIPILFRPSAGSFFLDHLDHFLIVKNTAEIWPITLWHDRVVLRLSRGRFSTQLLRSRLQPGGGATVSVGAARNLLVQSARGNPCFPFQPI